MSTCIAYFEYYLYNLARVIFPLQNYIAPQMVLFGSITDSATAFNNYRIYGTILLFIMFIWVFLGVKFVSKFSPIALACVILSILAIYIGIFVSAKGPGGPR